MRFQEEQAELDIITAKRQKRGRQTDDKPMEERTILHVKDAYDYQGRSYLHVPQDVGVNLRSEDPPEKCFIPKKLLHTWQGHSKGVHATRFFPKSGHLILSCGMDCKIKVRTPHLVAATSCSGSGRLRSYLTMSMGCKSSFISRLDLRWPRLCLPHVGHVTYGRFHVPGR